MMWVLKKIWFQQALGWIYCTVEIQWCSLLLMLLSYYVYL